MRVYFLLMILYFAYVSIGASIYYGEEHKRYEENTQKIKIQNETNVVYYSYQKNLLAKKNNTIPQTNISTETKIHQKTQDRAIIATAAIWIIYAGISLIEQFNCLSILNHITQIQMMNQQQIEEKIKQQFGIVYLLNYERSFNSKRIVNNIFYYTNKHQNYAPYVQNVQSSHQMFKYYGLRNSVSKKTLKSICSKFRLVRGDGNRLYTAFGYQYLSLILLEYDEQSFQQVLMKYNNLSFRITTHLGYGIEDQNSEKLLREEFFYKIQQLRKIKDLNKRKKSFFIQFSVNDDHDQFLHTLSIIFFRNLVYSLLEKDYIQCDSILEWEKEYDNDEYLIKLLSEELNITSQVVQFDGEFITTIYYNEQYLPLFIFLLKQEHYSIGIQ